MKHHCCDGGNATLDEALFNSCPTSHNPFRTSIITVMDDNVPMPENLVSDVTLKGQVMFGHMQQSSCWVYLHFWKRWRNCPWNIVAGIEEMQLWMRCFLIKFHLQCNSCPSSHNFLFRSIIILLMVPEAKDWCWKWSLLRKRTILQGWASWDGHNFATPLVLMVLFIGWQRQCTTRGGW